MKFRSITATALALGLATGSASAAPTLYSTASDFTAATTGVATTNFEGTTTSNFVAPLAGAGFNITATGNYLFLADPTYTQYYYNWGTGDVLGGIYSNTITINFTTAVTAFALDLGTFYDDGLSSTPAGAPSTFYGLPLTIDTGQGAFNVATSTSRNMTFFGATSDTAFTSVTIKGAGSTPSSFTVLDNLRIGSAVISAVPEPATWATMLLGFGFVGGMLRATRGKRARKALSPRIA